MLISLICRGLGVLGTTMDDFFGFGSFRSIDRTLAEMSSTVFRGFCLINLKDPSDGKINLFGKGGGHFEVFRGSFEGGLSKIN